MKHLKLTLFAFICIYFFSQSSYGQKAPEQKCNNATAVSPKITPYLDLFIRDCKARDVNYDKIYCLKLIGLATTDSIQNLINIEDSILKIDKRLLNDSTGMKFALYHELGHWFGLPHGTGIMKPRYNSDYDKVWATENWDWLVDLYFDVLKAKKP